GTGQWPGGSNRSSQRHLCAGSDPVRNVDGNMAVPGLGGSGDGAENVAGTSLAGDSQARAQSATGGGLSQDDRQGAAEPVSDGRGSDRRAEKGRHGEWNTSNRQFDSRGSIASSNRNSPPVVRRG